MAGNRKQAQIVTDHLHTPVEAAAPITRAGHAKLMILTGGLGVLFAGLLGGKAKPGEIKVPGRTWLALMPGSFALIGSDPLRGRPKGDAFARISYAEVAAVELTTKSTTVRARVTLHDGRGFAFETHRRGTGKAAVEVIELLRGRCLAHTGEVELPTAA